MPSPFASPLGSTPFGVGTPLPAGPPPVGNSGLCRYLDGLTGDYAIDHVTGHLASMPVTRQRVLLAILTVKGSSSVLPNMGIRRPPKIDATTTWAMQREVERGLAPLVDEHAIRIDRIAVEQVEGSGRIRVTVSFTDLQTGKPDSASA